MQENYWLMMLKGEKKMSKVFKILTINPGSTSTKIAIFANDNLILEKKLRHSMEEINIKR